MTRAYLGALVVIAWAVLTVWDHWRRRVSLPFPHPEGLAVDEDFCGHLTDASRYRRAGTSRIAPGSPGRILRPEGDVQPPDPRICPICRRVIVNDAHGGPHPSPGDHDSGDHVLAAYGNGNDGWALGV